MHLDTVFTQVDVNKFAIHKGCYEKLKIYRITKDFNNDKKVKVIELDQKLEDVLESYIGLPITLTGRHHSVWNGSTCFHLLPTCPLQQSWLPADS